MIDYKLGGVIKIGEEIESMKINISSDNEKLIKNEQRLDGSKFVQMI